MLKLLDKSHTRVHTIAYILGAVSVFGYVISFIRDRVFAHYFGPGELLDIYVASFKIPDTLFILATAFISVYALLPMFEEKQQQGPRVFQDFINTTFYFILLFLVIGGTIIFFATPFLQSNFFSGFSAEGGKTFILFNRIFLLQAALFTVSSFLVALLQLKRKFLLYSLLPIVYNAGIIIGSIFLYPIFGVWGLASGVVIGAVMSVCIQLPIIFRNRIVPIPAPTKAMVSEAWRTIKMSVPRALALLSIGIANIIIFSMIVSLSEGLLSVYYFAENLKNVPLAVIGTAYAVATFPILVSYFNKQNLRDFRATIEGSFRRLFFFILPLIAYVFVLREPLISIFFETGLFTEETTFITGTMLGMFIFSAFSMSILVLCARALYACNRSLIPFLVFFSLAVVEVVGVMVVIDFLQTNREPLLAVLEWTGIAEGRGTFGILFAVITTIVTAEIIAAAVIFITLARIINLHLRPIFHALLQNLFAIIILALVVIGTQALLFSTVQYNTLWGICTIGIMSILGAAFWYATLRLLGNKESKILYTTICRTLRLTRAEGTEPTDEPTEPTKPTDEPPQKNI